MSATSLPAEAIGLPELAALAGAPLDPAASPLGELPYLLLRLAARDSRSRMPALRFSDLVSAALFIRKPLARLDKPPEVNPSKPGSHASPNQIEFCYV